MWKYRESFISPRTYFDIDKEESGSCKSEAFGSRFFFGTQNLFVPLLQLSLTTMR
jgi:hypothetical protein